MPTPKNDAKAPIPQELQWIARLTDLMDSSFRIPVLNIRFGLDPIIGLIPGIGEAITFGISALMLLGMARNGASGGLLLRMLGNVALDALVGTVPVAGDLFDFVSKANRRNLRLMLEHYQEGRHQGGAWGTVALLALALLAMMAGLLYGIGWMLAQLAGLLGL
jgi:hypothetical protein